MLVQNVFNSSSVPSSQNSKKEKRFLCDVCNKQFQHKGNLNSHMRSHTGERPYSCDVCDKRFSTSGILKTHMRTHTGEKPYLCDTCGKRFSHIGILKNHMLTHSGERPHRCPIPDCGKDYSRAANLKIHMRSHTGERPFRCEYPKCEWTFVSSTDLKVHLKSHTGEKPFTCNVSGCGQQFTDHGNLKSHIMSHNNTTPEPTRDTNTGYKWIALESDFRKNFVERFKPAQMLYACSMCSKGFEGLAKLKQHIKEHDTISDTRPYKCGDCAKKFSQPRNIHRHMVLSHGQPETTGPFTLALMSPERTPFADKNEQTQRGRKRPLDELHKSAFTPVAKSPTTSPTGKTSPGLTQLFITGVKSLREEVPSHQKSSLCVKKEKVSPGRVHPYAKPKQLGSRPVPKIAPKPAKMEVDAATPSPPAPLRIHTPENVHSVTFVDELRYAAVAASFNLMVQGALAYRSFQTLRCFYKCLTTAKQSIELGAMPW